MMLLCAALDKLDEEDQSRQKKSNNTVNNSTPRRIVTPGHYDVRQPTTTLQAHNSMISNTDNTHELQPVPHFPQREHHPLTHHHTSNSSEPD